MNNTRRKQLKDLLEKIETLKDKLEDILSEEEYAFDNLPENLQGSIRGEACEEAIGSLENAIGGLEEAIDAINEIV